LGHRRDSPSVKSDKAPNSTCAFVKSARCQSRVCGVRSKS